MKNGTANKIGEVAKKGKAASGATTVVLSIPSIAAILALSMIAAFSLGRYLSAQGFIQFALFATEEPAVFELPTPPLPDLPLFKNKKVPFTRYTSRLFDNKRPVRSSTALRDHDDSAEYVTDEHGNKSYDMNLTNPLKPSQESLPHEDDVFHPAGQHLLLDITHVEADFLNSEVRLATAMIDVITQSEFTLLSYHCRGLIPEGVSCVGILLEGHVSLDTWPAEGVIALDLFTCVSQSLLPLVQVIYKLFGLPRQGGVSPEMVWNHKKRGFRYTDGADVVNGLSDLDRFLGDAERDKDQVFSTQTAIHKIDIYDSIEARFRNHESYRRSLTKDGSYESQNPELFQKDRLLFIDGVLHSQRFGETAYHEAMVHPAMITHEDPKRVVIVGGGEGAALREVLKHNTVEKVVLLEADTELPAAAKTFLSAWNDCSTFIPGVESCFDDPRLEVHNVDAVDWFSDFFGKEHDQDLEHFDIVIVDALDPSIETEETDRLFANEEFVESIYNSLGKDGILVAHLGESEAFDSVPDSYWNNGLMDDFFWSLEEAGFQGVSEYEEMYGRVAAPMRFIAAMKNRLSRTRWFGTEAEISVRLRTRMMPAADGSLPLRLFDAASMMQYTYPHRAEEERFCKGNPSYCGIPQDVFRPGVSDHPVTSFEVGPSTVCKGRGVFAKVDISARDYLSLDECVNQMFVPPETNSILFKAQEQTRGIFWDTFAAGYLDGYGVQDDYFGDPSTAVDPGILTFVNHGCGGTYNIGSKTEGNEVTLELGHPAMTMYEWRDAIYNPHSDRRYFAYDCTGVSALRDIQAGEEILDNYIMFGGADQSDFDENLKELKSICGGSDGIVNRYEWEHES